MPSAFFLSQDSSLDEDLLDAYSRAVTSVVDRASAAVVSLEVGGRGRRGGRAARGQGGAGSGFVVAPDGYLLTNSHVVAAGGEVRVRAPTGEPVPAEVEMQRVLPVRARDRLLARLLGV